MTRPIQPYPDRIINKFLLDDTGCWLWSCGSQFGYGITHVRINGKMMAKKAHRVFYELFVGPIPEGLQIDHLCRTTLCVNPDHLEAVTPKENNYRSNSPSALNAKKTHCLNGHELTGGNIYHHPKRPNVRDCRTCRTDAGIRYRRRVIA